MKQSPKNIFSLNAFWGHVICIPLFALGLLLLFCPFAFKNYDITFGRYSFHIVMIFCIILGVLLAVRLTSWPMVRKTVSIRRELPPHPLLGRRQDKHLPVTQLDEAHAVLDVSNVARIPVSKNYYDQIAAIL